MTVRHHEEGELTPLDALAVIDEINAGMAAAAEGEGAAKAGAAQTSTSALPAFPGQDTPSLRTEVLLSLDEVWGAK